MARAGSLRQGSDGEPRGEKHPPAGGVSGEAATQATPRCDLCTHLRHVRRPHKRRRTAVWIRHGLRIALLDDDAGTRNAAREMVRAQRDGWTLIIYRPPHAPCQPPTSAEAPHGSGQGADSLAGLPPDIALIALQDSDLPDLACVRKLKALRRKLPVVVISGQCNEESVARACMAGADGFMIKPVTAEELARAVNAAAQERPALCPEAEKAVMNFLRRVGASLSSRGLTRREQEIVCCLAEHLSDKEIAQRLRIAPNTVHVHLGRLLRKSGAHCRQQLVAKFLGGGRAKSNPFITPFCYWAARAQWV